MIDIDPIILSVAPHTPIMQIGLAMDISISILRYKYGYGFRYGYGLIVSSYIQDFSYQVVRVIKTLQLQLLVTIDLVLSLDLQ